MTVPIIGVKVLYYLGGDPPVPIANTSSLSRVEQVLTAAGVTFTRSSTREMSLYNYPVNTTMPVIYVGP